MASSPVNAPSLQKYERETGDEKKGTRSVERRYGRFERTLKLPQSVDAEKMCGR